MNITLNFQVLVSIHSNDLHSIKNKTAWFSGEPSKNCFKMNRLPEVRMNTSKLNLFYQFLYFYSVMGRWKVWAGSTRCTFFDGSESEPCAEKSSSMICMSKSCETVVKNLSNFLPLIGSI